MSAAKKITGAYSEMVASKLYLFSFINGFLLAGIVFSASRAGLITFAVLIIALLMSHSVNRRLLKYSLGYAAIIWIVFQLLWLLLSMDIFEDKGYGNVYGFSYGYESDYGGTKALSPFQSMFSNSESNQDRWETITRGLDMWADSPVLGAGLGVFIERSAQWLDEPLVIHSTPVWILAEFGLVGLAIFIWVIFVFARYALSHRIRTPADRIVAMLLLVFITFCLVHEIFYQRIFWLVLGAALTLPGYMNVKREPLTKATQNA